MLRKILITQRILQHSGYPEQREALASDWGKLCESLEFLPIPVLSDIDPQGYLSLSPDGVILSGGNDLGRFDSAVENQSRDRIDTKILELAIERRIPVLGVCRGMQILAEYFGMEVVAVTEHAGTEHPLTIDASTRWGKELADRGPVRSFHSFGIKAVKEPFHVVARAPDGSIEAFSNDRSRILGIMWHPERGNPTDPVDMVMIKDFFNSRV